MSRRRLKALVKNFLIGEDCWTWDGTRGRGGYGHFGSRPPQMAHRAVYELLVGPIPEGFTLDHLCRNRACVNPAHLEAVTMRENTMRSPVAPAAVHARQTECVHGHPLSGDNLRIRMTPRGAMRVCQECRREAKRRAYARKVGREVRAYSRPLNREKVGA